MSESSSTLAHAAFGQRDGSHQLLSWNHITDLTLLEQLRFLVDRPAGYTGSEVRWSPYWGCGPVGEWWVVWRGDEDLTAPRRNMVSAKAAMIRLSEVTSYDNIESLLQLLSPQRGPDGDPLAIAILNALASADPPVLVTLNTAVPEALAALWKNLWPAARATLSLRTMFGPEVLESGTTPAVVAIPAELTMRWRPRTITDPISPNKSSEPVLDSFPLLGNDFTAFVRLNRSSLPEELLSLARVKRLMGVLSVLRGSQGQLSDALLVLRTAQALTDSIRFADSDEALLRRKLMEIGDTDVVSIRSLSLISLDPLEGVERNVAESVSRWISRRLPAESDTDACWILEQSYQGEQKEWWTKAVVLGLEQSLKSPTKDWVAAVWRWCTLNPDALAWLHSTIPRSQEFEDLLLDAKPAYVQEELELGLKSLCCERDWAKLFASMLPQSAPLEESVRLLKESVAEPERGIGVLLRDRSAVDVVSAAVITAWGPLLNWAADLSARDSNLFSKELLKHSESLITLIAFSIERGGEFPALYDEVTFFVTVFDDVFSRNPLALKIALLPKRGAAAATLVYPRLVEFLSLLEHEVGALFVERASSEWFAQYASGKSTSPVERILRMRICNDARHAIPADSPIQVVIDFAELFPEIGEEDMMAWLGATGFLWQAESYEKLAVVLRKRGWRKAVRAFKYSWKAELRSVAWHCCDLLDLWDRVGFSEPDTSVVPSRVSSAEGIGSFLGSRGSSEDWSTSHGIDLGIITIKTEELDAVVEKLRPSEHISGNRRSYDVSNIETKSGSCRVAITRCLKQGNLNAQGAASEMLSDLAPSFVIVVGIAGAMPSVDFGLGDVVVSDRIYDLTVEDTGTEPDLRRYSPSGGPVHPEASRIVERLSVIVAPFGQWRSPQDIGASRPDANAKYTTSDKNWNREIKASLTGSKKRGAPIVVPATIASSDRLIKDPQMAKQWRTSLKGIAAVEMESAGVYVLCQREGTPFLSIRGISDIIGWKRDEDWTRYACHTAASLAKVLILSGAFRTAR